MKTIFVSILQGVEAKSILRTDIYRSLISVPDVKLVFFVGSLERADYYKREFNHDRIVYEIFPKLKLPRAERFFSALKFRLIKTSTLDLRREMAAHENFLNYFLFPFTFLFNRIFARPFFRKIVRKLDYLLITNNSLNIFFDKYKPCAVFLAHLFDDYEIAFLKGAKRRRISSFGLVNSWDKLTARCMIRILPDKLFVFNEVVKAEACQLADMSPENVIPVGIPHYDHYFKEYVSTKENFYKKVGIDPGKSIILYSPIGKDFSDSDWDIIDLLQNYIKNGSLVKPAELLVRFQPNDFIDVSELARRPWLKYCWPGRRFSFKRGVDWDMDFGDLRHLHNTLFYLSVLVCYAASISVDATVFNKPVININFEPRQPRVISRTPTYFYKMAHYQKALSTGGLKLVRNQEELLCWLNKYLENPDLDSDKRKFLVNQQCWCPDGKAGYRIGSFILSHIQQLNK